MHCRASDRTSPWLPAVMVINSFIWVKTEAINSIYHSAAYIWTDKKFSNLKQTRNKEFTFVHETVCASVHWHWDFLQASGWAEPWMRMLEHATRILILIYIAPPPGWAVKKRRRLSWCTRRAQCRAIDITHVDRMPVIQLISLYPHYACLVLLPGE